jgi:hypothetical protein
MRCLSLSVMFGLATLVGCGGGDSPAPQAATQQTVALAPQQRPAEPISAAAYDFISAVVQGETQRATSLLTPQAVQQFAAAGKQFAFPGMGSATFQIGQTRKASETQAAVQCLLADSQAGGQEEMCCLMRMVDGAWRVSGIAFEVGANQPPQVLDFERPDAPPTAPAASPATNPQFATQPGQPNPSAVPRTAQDPGSAPTR